MSELEFLTRANAILPRNAWSIRHLQVLLALNEKGSERYVNLTKSLGILKPSLTRVNTTLCAYGLITSRRHATDKRGVTLTITDKGRDIIRQIRGEELQQELAA